MKLSIDDIAVSAYLRDAAKQQLGPDASPLQYVSLLAHAWQCTVPEVVERTRDKIRRDFARMIESTREDQSYGR